MHIKPFQALVVWNLFYSTDSNVSDHSSSTVWAWIYKGYLSFLDSCVNLSLCFPTKATVVSVRILCKMRFYILCPQFDSHSVLGSILLSHGMCSSTPDVLLARFNAYTRAILSVPWYLLASHNRWRWENPWWYFASKTMVVFMINMHFMLNYPPFETKWDKNKVEGKKGIAHLLCFFFL